MEIATGTNPFNLFQSWFDEAVAVEINDPDAIALASVNADGMPSVRMVLLRQWSEDGFLFFTNYKSRKAGELLATGKAAFCMHWKSLRKQIRVTGQVRKASAAQSDAYFDSRGRGSQIGAWASDQSRPLESRAALMTKVDEFDNKLDYLYSALSNDLSLKQFSKVFSKISKQSSKEIYNKYKE